MSLSLIYTNQEVTFLYQLENKMLATSLFILQTSFNYSWLIIPTRLLEQPPMKHTCPELWLWQQTSSFQRPSLYHYKLNILAFSNYFIFHQTDCDPNIVSPILFCKHTNQDMLISPAALTRRICYIKCVWDMFSWQTMLCNIM